MFPVETLIRNHLEFGVYPPINPAFVPMAIRAVRLCNEGDGDVLVVAPGDTRAAASDIVAAMRLESFVERDSW